MQNLHKSTHDRPLTGVHWPIHRGWCRGSRTKGDLSTSTSCTHRGAGWRTEAIIHITTRGLDRIIDRTIRMSTRRPKAMDRLSATTSTPHADRESKMALTLGWHVPVCVMTIG